MFAETFGAVPLEVEPSSVLGSDCKALPEVAELPICCEEADQMLFFIFPYFLANTPALLMFQYFPSLDSWTNPGYAGNEGIRHAGTSHVLRPGSGRGSSADFGLSAKGGNEGRWSGRLCRPDERVPLSFYRPGQPQNWSRLTSVHCITRSFDIDRVARIQRMLITVVPCMDVV